MNPDLHIWLNYGLFFSTGMVVGAIALLIYIGVEDC